MCLLCAGLGIPKIGMYMTAERFQNLKAGIRFVPRGAGSGAPRVAKNASNYDRLWKVRPLIDALNKAAQANFLPGRFVTLDEQMIFSRGTCSQQLGRQHNAMKSLFLSLRCSESRCTAHHHTARTPCLCCLVVYSACGFQDQDAEEAHSGRLPGVCIV